MHMIDEAPIKQKWIQWANIEQRQSFVKCTDDAERRRTAITLVKKLKENKIHFGRRHTSSNRVNALPENMLIYLWLLRYMIHDEDTLKKAIVFFSADKLPYVEEDKRNIFHPDWIKQNIIQPCSDVIDLLTDDSTKTHAIFATHCGLAFPFITKRIKESILYAMTSAIINTIVTNGYPADCLTSTGPQRDRIRQIKQEISKMNNEDIWPVEQDLYTIFLQAIPYIIEKNIEKHWEGMLRHFYKIADFVTDKSWPEKISNAPKETKAGKQKKYNPAIDYNPTMHHFDILLPLQSDDDSIEFLTINEYFTALRVGNVPSKQIFIRPQPSSRINELKAKRRHRRAVAYDENDDEDEDDDDEEEENIEGDGGTPKKKRAKKRQRTPKTSKTTIPVKSEEKIRLEKNMQETMEGLDETFSTLKNTIEKDETAKIIVGKLKDKWDLMKLQFECYKNKE